MPERLIGDHEPAILKLLRGDRDALDRLVTALAGAVPADRRHWQLAISGLVDAILGRAIEASALEFPADNPFWAMFNEDQARDIATALASFSYRFDGLGGFVDGRVPSQRDLSLAVGYAGLRPDADPALADRGRDRPTSTAGWRWRPATTWPALPAA